MSILIVEDEPALSRAYERHLRRRGYNVRVAADIAGARELLESEAADVAFVDFGLPDGNGAQLVEWARTDNRINAAYCITGQATTKTAVEVIRAGCEDIIEKPVPLERLSALANRHESRDDSSEDLDTWRERFCPEIIGRSEALAGALSVVRNVADSDATVLITGESGTGKELIARAVHTASPRHRAPFVALNCAAIPDSLIEAELFGHARGAFTGAVSAREGRVACADGGTLFLDEIGDMPLAAQAKLLRMLQDRCIVPLGADRAVPIDVRIVAATNKNLEQMVDEGTFRADLYYRLSVIPVHLPPLRERTGDIAMLAESFLTEANERNGRNVRGMDASARRVLERHRWNGNVRELMHRMERAVLLKGSGILSAEDMPRMSLARGTGQHQPIRIDDTDQLDLRSAIDQVERRLIDTALERTGGNRTEAAGLLGLNRTTLVEKIRKHGSNR